MKRINLLGVALITICFIACASPEQRSNDETDTTTIQYKDTTATDTVTNVDGRSGDNGTGTDTTNTAEQKAIRESGQ